MKFYVYIIYSACLDKYYIGHTDNLEKRVSEHCIRKNLGASDWKLMHVEEFETRAEAMKRELGIKRKKRRTYLEWLIAKE